MQLSPSDTLPNPFETSSTLSEQQVIEGFHSFLQSALAQAKAEKLLDAETLASAESDLMVSAPALCLFFAALRSTTDPPSVPLTSKGNTSSDEIVLSRENCPAVFLPMFKVWESTVPIIQRLQSNRQHDLARIVCNLEPIGHRHALNVIAAQLRGVAVEISQRRTFQERFQTDLQAALNANGGTRGGETSQVKFTPPPLYAEKESPGSSSPTESERARRLFENEPVIVQIRETLFASLGDVISTTPSLRTAMKTDPPRAYFSSVALAILEASLTPRGTVRGALNTGLTIEDCPVPLRPFMLEFDSIEEEAVKTAEKDDEDAIRMVSEGATPPEPRIDRVRKILLDGLGENETSRSSTGEEGLRISVEGRALQFATRINMLALKMTSLPAFRSYAKNVFDILGGLV